jgi:hypothetical protein
MSRSSNPSPVSVKILEEHKLLVEFENAETRVFDVAPYLEDKYFASLKNSAIFKSVKTNGLTLEWIGGIDICPDELYENSVKLS